MTKTQLLTGGALALAATLLATAVFAAQPAFNCNYARQSTELLLCTNEALAATDQRNSRIWYEVLATLSPAAKRLYNAAGREWIKERNRCGWDVGCVEQSYIKHIAQMCAFANWSTPGCQEEGGE